MYVLYNRELSTESCCTPSVVVLADDITFVYKTSNVLLYKWSFRKSVALSIQFSSCGQLIYISLRIVSSSEDIHNSMSW